MVEPIAGILGAVAIMIAEPLLPYTLAFAAGAMVYVVIDDIIPEAQTWYGIVYYPGLVTAWQSYPFQALSKEHTPMSAHWCADTGMLSGDVWKEQYTDWWQELIPTVVYTGCVHLVLYYIR